MAEVNHVIVRGAPSTPKGAVKLFISGTKLFNLGVLGNVPSIRGEAFDLWLDP